MDDKKVMTGEIKGTPDTKENYEKPEVGSVKRPDRAAFGCERCEHEHDGAADRCSGL